MNDTQLEGNILRRALRRLGWTEAGSFRDVLQYWEPIALQADKHESSRTSERLVLPLREDASDSQDLLLDASGYLLQTYGEEFIQIIQTVKMMLTRHLDEIEVRRETNNSAGFIQWQLGNEAILSTREILSASAKAAASRKKRFFNAGSVISEEFLAQCFMGQTKVGSYVVTALTPAEASLATSRSKDNAKAYPRIEGRAVIETLAESLGAVRDAIDEVKNSGGQIEAFELAVASGVSHELLAALEPLTRGSEAGIEIAYFRAEDEGNAVETRPDRAAFVFTPEDSVVITKARDYFEATPDPKEARLTGEVTYLKNSSSAAEHQIKLATRVNGRPKMVTVELTPEQYDQAVEAHSRKRLFTVVGALEMKQRGSYVTTPEQVRVEETNISEVSETHKETHSVNTPLSLFEK